jgi:RNA polymerase sigma-70 factor, ECF subfamily
LPRVYNFLRYRLGNEAIAEDLTSRAFEKAWRDRHRYRRDVAGFSTWLLSIARNVAVDYHRTTHHHAPLEEADDVADVGTPEDEALAQSNFSRLSLLLSTLTERERELLALKYGAGATNRAIAQITGLSESAGTLAGIAVRLPAWLPPGLTLQRIEVSGDQSWTVTASAEKLQRALDTFGINDLSVPAGIDGQVSSIYVPPVVRVTCGTQSHRVVFVEARQPDATLPAGIDLPQLAQIGLRVLGVDRTQAHRFAQEVDWRTTLVVPVPAEGSVFRRVDIQGNSGLLVEPVHGASGSALPVESTLLWSAGNSVFALSGSVSSEELFEMAQSVQ